MFGWEGECAFICMRMYVYLYVCMCVDVDVHVCTERELFIRLRGETERGREEREGQVMHILFACSLYL